MGASNIGKGNDSEHGGWRYMQLQVPRRLIITIAIQRVEMTQVPAPLMRAPTHI